MLAISRSKMRKKKSYFLQITLLHLVSTGIPFGPPQNLKAKKMGMSKDGLEILEHPFITLRSFPDGFVQRIGGLVSHEIFNFSLFNPS